MYPGQSSDALPAFEIEEQLQSLKRSRQASKLRLPANTASTSQKLGMEMTPGLGSVPETSDAFSLSADPSALYSTYPRTSNSSSQHLSTSYSTHDIRSSYNMNSASAYTSIPQAASNESSNPYSSRSIPDLRAYTSTMVPPQTTQFPVYPSTSSGDNLSSGFPCYGAPASGNSSR